MAIISEILENKNAIIVIRGRERDVDNMCITMRKNPGTQVRILRGSRGRARKDFLAEAAAALQFPYYFGMNWSAFEECINDMRWMTADRYLFFITEADKFLEESRDDIAAFIEIISDASHRWNNGKNTFPTDKEAVIARLSVVMQVDNSSEIPGEISTYISSSKSKIIDVEPFDDID